MLHRNSQSGAKRQKGLLDVQIFDDLAETA